MSAIPQLFTLRRLTIVANERTGKVRAVFYVYCNYRNTIKGIINASDPKIKGCKREYAKKEIQERYPNAEFWR